MRHLRTLANQKILAGLHYTGIDRIYQQLSSERGLIVTFHHVNNKRPDVFSPNQHLTIQPQFLSSIIQILKNRGFDLVSMDEALERITAASAPKKRFAALSFDDGYMDTLQVAAPILQQHQAPYIVYLAPGLVQGSAYIWWEGIEHIVRQNNHLELDTYGTKVHLDCSSYELKVDSFNWLINHFSLKLPEREQKQATFDFCKKYGVDLQALTQSEILNWEQIKRLQQDPLCTIGTHTFNHEAIARLTQSEALEEMDQGRRILQEKLGIASDHHAFPYGYPAAAGQRDFLMAQSLGFKTAVTTRPGMIFPEHQNHLTALPRISANGLFQRKHYFSALTSGLPTRLHSNWARIDVE